MPYAILTFDEGLDTIYGGTCEEGKTMTSLQLSEVTLGGIYFDIDLEVVNFSAFK